MYARECDFVTWIHGYHPAGPLGCLQGSNQSGHVSSKRRSLNVKVREGEHPTWILIKASTYAINELLRLK